MKLISMVDFVLSTDMAKSNSENALCEIENYAKFLKQPLTLGIFVPCVDNEPFNYALHGNKEHYDKAKEEVLFEGFEIHELLDGETKRITCPNGFFNIAWYNDDKGWYFSKGIEGILVEDLLKYDLELTKNALKQIGL